MIKFLKVAIVALLSNAVRAVPNARSGAMDCTWHAYEDLSSLGEKADYNPPWCGMRYSSLDLNRLVAISNMDPSLCGKCVRIQGANGGPAMYALAVDQRGAAGLDISGQTFQALFPNDNIRNPQTCSFQVVDDSYCSGICCGTAEECTPGVRNSLPYNLLPPATGCSNVVTPPKPIETVVPISTVVQYVSTSTIAPVYVAPTISYAPVATTTTTSINYGAYPTGSVYRYPAYSAHDKQKCQSH